MSAKVQFASRIGLIAATVGSAVGLGNVWRFPAEVHSGGGAAFLIIYIGCVVLLGIPVMLSEMVLGRAGRSDAIGSLKRVGASRRWWVVGGIAIAASYIILCFYMVVAGWTLEYFVDSISGDLFAPLSATADESLNAHFQAKMEQYITTSWNPLLFTLIMIVINTGVLIAGVQKGIERMSNIMMPLFFLVLLVFVGVALSLPGAGAGLEYYLRPDFSKVTPNTVISALGQAFFSLSLGMGILITYSAYFPAKERLTRTAVTISLLDLLVAFMMGLVIFPSITSFGLDGSEIRGATLVFVTLPEVFSHMGMPQVWSTFFFFLLAVAALTSTISIAEVTVAFIVDRFKTSRLRACLLVSLPLIPISAVCSLSMGLWSNFTILGMNIFDFLDTFATNILLPLGSILLCIFIGWFAPRSLMYDQLSNQDTLRSRLTPVIIWIVKYMAPALIFIVLVSAFI